MTEMNAKEMAKLAIHALEEKKAEDISVIDISGVTVLADYFLIASGNNRNQVQALSDSVEEALGRAGVSPRQVEGYNAANWVLMDYGDIIVHIFDRENRLFYDLERIWRDYAGNPRRLARAVRLLRQMRGFGSEGAFYDGVAVSETFERDFRPIGGLDGVIPVMRRSVSLSVA